MTRRTGALALMSLLTALAGAGLAQVSAPPASPPPLGATLGEPCVESAPSPAVLGLRDLEAMALDNSPVLSRAAAQVEAVQGKWVQAGLYPNPRVGYQGMEIGNLGTAGMQGGFVSQRIVTAGKLGLNRRIAEQEIQQALHGWEADKLRVLSDVRMNFAAALVGQQRLEVTRKLVDIGKEAVKASTKLHDAKQVGLNDVLQAKIEADTAEILLGKAQNQYRAAWQKLAAVVGFPRMEPLALVGEPGEGVPAFAWEETLNQLLARSPELAGAVAGIERARWQVSRARVEVVPDVDVTVGVMHNNMTGFDVANVMVGIPLPLFDRNQGNVRQARAELAASHSEARRLELSLQNRLAQVFQRYADAALQVQKYRERILPNARQSLELVRKGYEQRQVDYLGLLVVQQTYFQANLAYLDAVQELRESAAILEGQLLQGSLQQNMK